ncbi:Bax inhibitor-1/YccA family protein [Mucilaginibacter angelicae]|uniref:Bax inhibitor-1/YccA family protein n=1 Tax=Mucilaginibacter angelicae TaxID=869718 RepID=A0ABV6LGY9_9SPHI
MEIKDSKFKYDNIIEVEDISATMSRRFLAGVFSWMFLALGVSAVTVYLFLNMGLINLVVGPTGYTGFGLFAIFSPLAFSLVMQFGYNRISYPILVLLFVAYATLIGISLSVIFLIYTAASILGVFITASVTFGIMAIAGYTTQMDLTRFGSILYILFIGIFVASLANFFMHSEQMSYIISYIGIAVFTGLTAYYMQMLKRIGAGIEYGDASSKKLALIGALALYITLINLFFMILRLFGRRR